MRFRARLDHVVSVGDRILVPPEAITEEWDTSTGGGKSFVPRRVTATVPRPGIVRNVRDRDDKVEVMCDDVEPLHAPIGAILTVIGPKYLCEPRDLNRLLDHLAGRRLTTDAQRAAVANAVTPWLRAEFPDLARLFRWVPPPEYATVAEYVALMDGIGAALGSYRLVRPLPFEVVVPPSEELPPGLDVSPSLSIRQDAVTRILGRNRAN